MSVYSLTIPHNDFQPDFSWTISRIAGKMKQKTFQVTSKEFKWTNYPVVSRVNLQLKDNNNVHVSLRLNDIPKEVSDSIVPKLYYRLKSESNSFRHICKSVTYLFSSKFGQPLTFENPFVHKSWLTHKSFNKDDSVVIEVHVEPPSMTKQVHSYDGTLNWPVENYRKRLMAERHGGVSYQEGPYFYTGSCGYRVQVVLMLNGSGNGKGRGTSANVYFLPGDFDEELPVCFRHRTTITLVNRKQPGSSICASVERDVKDEKCYGMELGSIEEVGKLVHNNILYCEVKVQAV